MRSLSRQTDRELGGPVSVLVRQKRDHVHLDGLLRILSVTTEPMDQDKVMLQVNRLVFPHAFAEESVLWPELRRVLPGGDELTLQVELEHQEVNELVRSLEDRGLDAADRRGLISRLIEVLRDDVRDEEDVLLPRLQESVSPARLRQLGVAWEVVRRVSPTRPHPVVSRRPPGNALAAIPLTVLDRSRDRLDAAARRWPRVQGPASLASRGAAQVAGVIEGFAPLRRGEHRETGR